MFKDFDLHEIIFGKKKYETLVKKGKKVSTEKMPRHKNHNSNYR